MPNLAPPGFVIFDRLASMDIICQLCHKKVRGASIIDMYNPAVVGALLLVHMVDEHWQILERIHATKDDPAARDALNQNLISEYPR